MKRITLFLICLGMAWTSISMESNSAMAFTYGLYAGNCPKRNETNQQAKARGMLGRVYGSPSQMKKACHTVTGADSRDGKAAGIIKKCRRSGCYINRCVFRRWNVCHARYRRGRRRGKCKRWGRSRSTELKSIKKYWCGKYVAPPSCKGRLSVKIQSHGKHEIQISYVTHKLAGTVTWSKKAYFLKSNKTLASGKREGVTINWKPPFAKRCNARRQVKVVFRCKKKGGGWSSYKKKRSSFSSGLNFGRITLGRDTCTGYLDNTSDTLFNTGDTVTGLAIKWTF